LKSISFFPECKSNIKQIIHFSVLPFSKIMCINIKYNLILHRLSGEKPFLQLKFDVTQTIFYLFEFASDDNFTSLDFDHYCPLKIEIWK